MKTSKIKLGASACLLGSTVRFDGGHKNQKFLTEIMSDFVEWHSFCPEISAGMSVPRETFRLNKGSENQPRFVGNRSGEDKTKEIIEVSQELLNTIEQLNLRGFIVKKDSPSCGLQRVKIYDGNGAPSRTGQGLFTQALQARFPNMPIEDEGRLNDPQIRENFFTRIFCYDRWIHTKNGKLSKAKLFLFHAEHKMLILAHSPSTAQELGRLLATADTIEMEDLLEKYEALFMSSLAVIASPGRHVNVMQHIAGFLKKILSSEDKLELGSLFQDYSAGRVPLMVPITLLAHHLRKTSTPWVKNQIYLSPYPSELGLRSSI